MKSKRMFSLDVVDTDSFLDMPVTSQALYFHLGMRADDDGFVSSPKKIVKTSGCNIDDLNVLISKGFLIPFSSGVVIITDWRINNYLRPDRYKETRYIAEKKKLTERNGKYELITDGIPDGTPNSFQRDTQIRLDKNKKEKNIYIVEQSPTEYPFKEIIEYLNQRTGKKFKDSSKATQRHIKAKFDEGFSLEDFKRVIDWKSSEWIGTEMEKYLRPETLFGTKFEGYLNAAPAAAVQETEVLEEEQPQIDLWSE